MRNCASRSRISGGSNRLTGGGCDRRMISTRRWPVGGCGWSPSESVVTTPAEPKTPASSRIARITVPGG